MASLETRLDPVKHLPVELIQRVIYYVVETPDQAKQIASLSHLSRSWRLVVLGMPKLFVSPDLVNWPDTVIEDWVSRSRGLPLDIRMVESGRQGYPTILSDGLHKVMAFAPRLRSLYIEAEGGQEDHPLIKFFGESPCFPVLQNLAISLDNDYILHLNLSTLPILHTINVPFQPIRVEGSSGTLKEIGCLIFDPADLSSLIELAGCQTTPFHLTIFTNIMHHLPEAFPLSGNSRVCWKWLTSLSMQEFNGGDDGHSGTLFSQIHAPQLRVLEVTDMDAANFDTLIDSLPSITARSVETLIIKSDKMSLRVDFSSLFLSNLEPQEIQAFPHMVELVICDVEPEDLHQLGLRTLEKCLSSRRGILKRLTLPISFRPKSRNMGDEETLGVEERVRNLGYPLTLQTEAKLIAAGNLDEIRYEYEMDVHGMELAPYLS